MKITIEATSIFSQVQGVPCRMWRDRTESGIACDLFIPVLRVLRSYDQKAFDSELRALPVETETIDIRQVI